VVYAGADAGTVFAFDAATGAALWIHSTGASGQTATSPVVVNGRVFVGSADSDIYAYGLP